MLVFVLIYIAYPDVEIHDIDENWEFVLLASDGIWDVLSNEDVVKICLRKIEQGLPPEQICEELMTECLSPDLLMTGTDNMTVVLICFLHNKPYEELIRRATEINKRHNNETAAKKGDESQKFEQNDPTTSLSTIDNPTDDCAKDDLLNGRLQESDEKIAGNTKLLEHNYDDNVVTKQISDDEPKIVQECKKLKD